MYEHRPAGRPVGRPGWRQDGSGNARAAAHRRAVRRDGGPSTPPRHRWRRGVPTSLPVFDRLVKSRAVPPASTAVLRRRGREDRAVTALTVGRGRLLVAAPPLQDPNFDRSVVLVLDHGDDGSVGVVLNRPAATPLAEVAPGWAPLAAVPAVLFVGGPVARDAAIALARAPAPGTGALGEIPGWVAVLDGVGSLDIGLDPAAAGPPVDALRVFAGYAGWSPGQLDGEIAAAGWFVVAAEPDDVFDPEPATLWRRVLRRQRGRLRVFADCPPDPATN